MNGHNQNDGGDSERGVVEVQLFNNLTCSRPNKVYEGAGESHQDKKTSAKDAFFYFDGHKQKTRMNAERIQKSKLKSNHYWQMKGIEDRLLMIKHLNSFATEMNKICKGREEQKRSTEERDREGEGKYHSLGRHH